MLPSGVSSQRKRLEGMPGVVLGVRVARVLDRIHSQINLNTGIFPVRSLGFHARADSPNPVLALSEYCRRICIVALDSDVTATQFGG